jgi:hypothetical protein
LVSNGQELLATGCLHRINAAANRYGLIIIIMVPRSRVVAEMKPHAWGEVHGYARAMMASPIANVVLVNVTTVV